MNRTEIIFTVINLIVAAVVGCSQIYIAKKVKDFEVKQDIRDEQRRNEQIYADATKFIQKYNKNGHKSEIYLIPLCVAAYKYDSIYPYQREIYREFCSLTEDVQNEILKRLDIDIVSFKYDNYFFDMLKRIIKTIEIYYNNDAKDCYFYDGGKYLKMALTRYGTEKVLDDLRYKLGDETKRIFSLSTDMLASNLHKDEMKDFKEYLTDLLACHKNENPLSSLLGYFQQNDEIIASYICCLIAKYSVIYNHIETDNEENLGYDCDYSGDRFMEDLFLDTLSTVEHCITERN